MQSLLTLVQAHPYVSGAFAMWVISAIISGMPEPRPTSGIAYTWLYRSAHWAAANIPTALKGQAARAEWTPEERAASGK
jgi:hypothetical protein